MQEISKNAHQTQDDRVMAMQGAEAREKRPFVEPKLTFVVPKLVKHGDVADLTQQGGLGPFFGTFSP